MSGKTHIGIGGWTFEPWRGTFYPDSLVQRRMGWRYFRLVAQRVNSALPENVDATDVCERTPQPLTNSLKSPS